MPRTPTSSSEMPERMYIIIVGAGKVGWNLTRELLEKGHEVTLIESDQERYLTVEQELEHTSSTGTPPSSGCSSEPGSRAPTW